MYWILIFEPRKAPLLILSTVEQVRPEMNLIWIQILSRGKPVEALLEECVSFAALMRDLHARLRPLNPGLAPRAHRFLC